MRVAVISNSDSLAFPAIQALVAGKALAGVAILERSSKMLLEPLLSIGVARKTVLLLNKSTWQAEMEHWLNAVNPDAVWIFGFPWIIPVTLLGSVPQGFLNFHFGDLPKYQGADPIFWQLRNNEPAATLTVHRMTEQVDAGPVVLQKQLPIIQGENYGLLCQRLGFMAAEVATQLIAGSGVEPAILTAQLPAEAAWFKRPGSGALKIKWNEQLADEIECLVNAANPKYDGATTILRGQEVRILETSPAEIQLQEGSAPQPGTIVYADALYGLIVACRDRRFLKINLVHMREGYFSGSKLFGMGVRPGEQFL